MAQDVLEVLRATDSARLVEIVRQDQRSPGFELLDWTVERFGDKGIANADTVFSFSGQGRDEHGIRPWRVVVKTFQDPGSGLDPSHLRYWKREVLAMETGLLTQLPGPIAAPRCYGVSDREGGAWVWMEHIADSGAAVWTTDTYALAAYELGRFNGRCFVRHVLPDYPWLCKDHVRTKSAEWPPHNAWESSYVSDAFSSQNRERILRLWDDRTRFYDALERLPQCFSHFDFHRRNLLFRRQDDGTEQIVAIDWAWAGYGALGADLYSVVGGSALIFELEAAEVAEIEAAAFEAYLTGLREAGWSGDPDMVRLAYTVTVAMFLTLCLPGMTAYASSDGAYPFWERQFKRPRAEIAVGWARLCDVALDRADEARALMDRLLER